ncbi:hypothetical protein GGR52DRAFT_581670 [Hypoxylon sp. FL1284]|nr:hypothetical protein GGR52DRAFT_581670 [Hypoxylon sp. FL1284]
MAVEDQGVPSSSSSTFYRNLDEALNVRRASTLSWTIVENAWQAGDAVDLCSGDILSLGRGGRSSARRAEFEAELARHPELGTGSGGVRLMDGNYGYLEGAERSIAAFHGAAAGLLVGSAFEANVAVWTALPRPGDVVLCDALVHTSTREGLRQSLALDRLDFPHNDVEGFRAELRRVFEAHRLVLQGRRCVLVAVEFVCSMDGDVCPLRELVDVAREVSGGLGNVQFVVDEAHSFGVIGPKGAGLVCELGLQKAIAVVVHSYGKAMGATGAIIPGNETIKGALANFARSVIYTTSPSFPFVAAIQSGYTLLKAGHTIEAQQRIQDLAKLFFESLTPHPLWSEARQRGVLPVALADGWEDRPFLTHIIAVVTRQNYIWWLYFHLLTLSCCVFPVEHPIVPAGQGRLRVILHASNTEDHVKGFVDAVFAWVEEMIDIEDGTTAETVSHTARWVYAWMREEGLMECKQLSSRGGYFTREDPGVFDAPFFSITPKEAASMDPQQRWMLEAAYRAMENAGVAAEKVAGTDTAVFAGTLWDDYAKILSKDPDQAPTYSCNGVSPSILANRLSWYFDLRGPSIQLNTACSSSMIATDLACQCLRSGRSSMALVAGANAILTPEESLNLEKMGFLSPDSRCYSFDHRANGYARGEGVAVLVLKKLGDAIRGGDMIRAVIRGSGSNQDGHTPGITQPSSAAQEDLIRGVYKSCGIDFKQTRYIEAHGTGTQLGDSTEAKALGRIFKHAGSVKANIGHLESVSGLADILKSVMILERGIIPPNALFERWNPKINAKLNNLEVLVLHRGLVPTSCIQWPTAGLRRISVNSFGFGGSNGHVVMDDALHTLEILGVSALVHTPTSLLRPDPTRDQREAANGVSQATEHSHATNGDVASDSSSNFKLLVWSAKGETALQRTLQCHGQYYDEQSGRLDKFVASLAYTLSARRSYMPWRSFAVVSDQALSGFDKLSPSKGVHSSREGSLAFVFTGQGAQYAKMGVDLLVYPVFRRILTHASNILQELGADWLLLDELLSSERIHSPEISQPLCVALQIALVELLQEFGVVPDVVVGHSSGEIAAAYTVGALSLESACKVAYHRGRLAQKVVAATSSKPGAMMSVNISEADVDAYLDRAGLSADISVACLNSSFNVSLSGDEAAIDELQRSLSKDEIFARKLNTGVAYHSPAMRQISDEYLSSLGSLKSRAPTSDNILLVSSVTGERISASAMSQNQYWVDNLVSPVYFTDAIQYLAVAAPKTDGLKAISTYIEIGPHGALRRPVTDTLSKAGRGKDFRYLPVLSKFDSPVKTVLEVVGQLFVHGHPVSVTVANQQHGPREGPFLVHWHETRISRGWRLRGAVPRTLLGTRVADWNPLEPRWRKMLRVAETPWLGDQVIGDTILFPATGTITMALEAVRQMAHSHQTVAGYRISEAIFMKPIVIGDQRETEVITQLRPLQQTYEKTSLRFEVQLYTVVDDFWSECFKSTIQIEHAESPNEVDSGQETRIASQTLARDYHAFYQWHHQQGLKYGNAFSLAEEICWDGDQIATAQVNVEPPIESYEGVVSPNVFDALCQAAYVAPSGGMSKEIQTTIPYRIRDAWVSATGWQYPHTRQVRVLTRSGVKPTGIGIECSIDALSDEGLPLCQIKKLDMLPFMSSTPSNDSTRKLFHRIDWQPQLSLLSSEQLRRYCDIDSPVADERFAVDYSCELNETLRLVLKYRLYPITGTEWEKVPPYLAKYVAFMDHLQEAQDEPSGIGSEEVIDGKLEELGASRPSWGMFIKIAQNLLPIVRGDIDASKLLSLTNLEQDFDEDLYSRFLCPHEVSGLRILETGVRSGAMTNLALSVLEEIEESTQGASGLEMDSERFAKCRSQDITSQGFQAAGHDVILVGGFLHRSENLSATLQNFRRMLKPGGHLVFAEITASGCFAMNFGFGILTDWWSRNDDSCIRGPLMSEAEWDTALRENGFSGNDLVIRDYEDDEAHNASLIISTVPRLPQIANGDTRIFKVVREEDHCQQSMAASLSKHIFDSQRQQPLIIPLNQLAYTQVSLADYVVFLADLSGSLLAEISEPIFNLVKDMVQKSKHLIWITLSEASVETSPKPCPYAGMTDGFLRTLRAEFNNKSIVSISLDHMAQEAVDYAPHISRVLTSVMDTASSELEYIIRGGRILTGRLVEDAQLNQELSSSICPCEKSLPWLPGCPLELAIGTRGELSTLHYREDAHYYKELGPKDVEIEAKAWAVNFRDAFTALGQLDEPELGIECAGIPGDRVCVCVPGCMRMYPRGDEDAVVKISPSISFEEACAITTPAITACQGERILIHSASGATGQLAIQIAQKAGAEVYATVSQSHKKQLLIDQYGIPEDHIFYSRSNNSTFARGVMRMTNGCGVDVVLNSLAGNGLRASWECDINENSPLPMACFANNVTFAAVDLVKKLLIHHPRPVHIYDGGKKSGRVVIQIERSTVVRKRLITRRTWRLNEDASYLVVGGLGGGGAKNLIVPSRSGTASTAAVRVVSELREENINIMTPECDVASRDSFAKGLKEWRRTMPPTRGCINAAMVLNDSVFENMSHAQWNRTIRSKVATSWNLHTCLAELDFMVLLSSVSGIVGNPGQSNYAAGCTFQDALARYRYLGVMRTVGVVAETESLQNRFAGGLQGFNHIEEHELLTLLDICCDPATDPAVSTGQIVMGMATPVDFLSRSLEAPEIMQRPLFGYFRQQASSADNNTGKSMDDNLTVQFRNAETVEERSDLVTRSLTRKLARTLAAEPDDVDTGKPLQAYGVDSLVAVELRNWILREFAAEVPIFELVGGKTVGEVGELVVKCAQK